MSNTVVSIENVSKRYQLGVIGTGTFYGDLKSWWARQRGKPDPYQKIGVTDHGNRQGETLWALKDISFQVQQGEVLGIIGRNGAGKSTLLKILSEVTTPTSGEVKIKGRIASLLEVGTGFHPDLTGRENVYLNGAILGMNKTEISRKFDEIVDFSGIEKFIDTPVKRYSSGMHVRLGFAVAAHLEPEILIVDEVLAVGDAEFQKKCLGKMGDVAQEGRTVLFVSHNMAAIEYLCQQGIMLNHGEVSFIGTQKEAVAHYLNSLNVKKRSLRESKREGSGLVRIIDIEYRAISGQLLKVLQSGQDVDIFLYYETSPNYTGGQVIAAITISNQLGVRVFSQTSRMKGTQFGQLPPSGTFVCRIPRLPLPPSTYHLNFDLKVDKEYADKEADAFELTVVEGRFFEGGVPNADQGVALVDGDWRLEISEPATRKPY